MASDPVASSPKFNNTKQLFQDMKWRRHKQMRRFRRYIFVIAILLGIILAITGIVVAFLVFTPLRMGGESWTRIKLWA